MQEHKCKDCGIVKAASEYRVHKRGYRIGKCKDCEREYQRQHYRKDIEKSRTRKRKHMARKRAENPEAARKYHRERHHKNHEANKQKQRDYYGRRFFWTKAMKLRGEGRASYKELASLWRKQRGHCALTGRRLGRDAQLDHKTPKARGGRDQLDNLQWLTPEVNLAKRDLTDEEFVALCRDVMRWIGERIQMVEGILESERAIEIIAGMNSNQEAQP